MPFPLFYSLYFPDISSRVYISLEWSITRINYCLSSSFERITIYLHFLSLPRHGPPSYRSYIKVSSVLQRNLSTVVTASSFPSPIFDFHGELRPWHLHNDLAPPPPPPLELLTVRPPYHHLASLPPQSLPSETTGLGENDHITSLNWVEKNEWEKGSQITRVRDW